MDEHDPRGWHSRGYLPHYDDGRKIQSVTYRLADALPAEVVARLEEQSPDDAQRRSEIERYLDAGHGSCWLRDPSHAEVVLAVWRHLDGVQYHLHAWVVMPNHVHVLIETLREHAIGAIIAAWKSVSARRILAGSATVLVRKDGERATGEVALPENATSGSSTTGTALSEINVTTMRSSTTSTGIR